MVKMSQQIYSAFVENVRERMAELELSQSDLAELLGVTRSYVSQILGGHRRPGLDTLETFSKALKTKPENLIRQLEKVA
jgi:transcriptional regulator with XRE-family HTH domain